MSILYPTFLDRIRVAVERDGRPLAGIARRAGYDPGYFRATLRGEKHNCTLTYVDDFASALGVDPLWLLGASPLAAELATAKQALAKIKEISFD